MGFYEINYTSEILDDLVKNHTKQLPSDFLSEMGKQTVKDYYMQIHKWYKQVRVFMLSNEFGDVSYVVFGFGYIGGLFSFLIRRPIKLFIFIVRRPLYFFDLIVYSLLSIKMDNELLYIFSSKSKTGLGSELIKSSLNLFELNTIIYVKTLEKTNNNVRFYKKNGFVHFKKIKGRIILKFIKSN